jgi:hypothetical protein
VNKIGTELSINFLVIIILSIIMFAVGVQITIKMFFPFPDPTPPYRPPPSGNTPVEIPSNKILISRGGNENIDIYLKNLHEDPSVKYFKMQVDCIQGFDSANAPLCDEALVLSPISCTLVCNKWVKNTGRCIFIQKKDIKVDGVLASVPKNDVKNGVYFFRLKVEAFTNSDCSTKDPDNLDVDRTIYITVKS